MRSTGRRLESGKPVRRTPSANPLFMRHFSLYGNLDGY